MHLKLYFKTFVLSISLLFCSSIIFSATEQRAISMEIPEYLLEHSVSMHAINDFKKLLSEACHCEVNINENQEYVSIVLPDIDPSMQYERSRFAAGKDFPYTHYPDHDYSWKLTTVQDHIFLQLDAPTPHGVAFGLYGLLQEKLGFLFYHPRQTHIPDLQDWPLREPFEWKATARFDKKGFHLHTMHPLELTEPLLDHHFPGGLQMITEYLDWLVRNGQNYFEFNLLESINLKRWPAYASEFVNYGKERGILMGLDLSLHMIQQKAFKLYKNPPASFRTRRNQIRRNLEKLFEADWDYINMEFSSTEFSVGNIERKEQLRLYIIELLENEFNSTLTGREHVVKLENKRMTDLTAYTFTEEEAALDKKRGTLIHTVMFYTLNDEKAPVYENENLQHMRELMFKEMKQRETWYYPESAYWITFDNSIPMLLLPYLSGRLDDILFCYEINLPGHVTFSSGWEWGYWLIDWSIARWSWSHQFHDEPASNEPNQYIFDLFQSERIKAYFDEAIRLHDSHLKDNELMRYMAAQTVTDEIPDPLRAEFQPRPRWNIRWLYRDADEKTLDSVRMEGIEPLRAFAAEKEKLHNTYHSYFEEYRRTQPEWRVNLLNELVNGIYITGLRAQHRAVTFEYLIEKRRSRIHGQSRQFDEERFLSEARGIRKRAQAVVDETEGYYRYPVELIARRYWGHTAYSYGYLYPASELHFWKREEEQIRRGRFGPLFMNIWEMLRIAGLKR